jgi:hypothetical protein
MHITHVHPQVDYYHSAQTMPYRYISSRLDTNIPQFFTQETYLDRLGFGPGPHRPGSRTRPDRRSKGLGQ